MNLPDPGVGRYWRLTLDSYLQLWQGTPSAYDVDDSPWSDQQSYLLCQDLVDVKNEAKLRVRANAMLAIADNAGTYYYENGLMYKL